MKTVQLQKSIITELTRKHPVRWLIGRYEEHTVLIDGFRAHLLNDDELYINPDRLGVMGEESLEFILDDYKVKDLCELTYTSSHRVDDYDLYRGDGFEIAINPKYLKYFEEYELKGSGEHRPVYVYELGELVGLVLPIRRPK